MIEIIAGTDRPGSRSFQVAQISAQFFKVLGAPAQTLSLTDIPMEHLAGGVYGQPVPAISSYFERINRAEGLLIVIPEYNGSFPGALKHFIDHWKFPDAFESRPVAFVGLGGRFGGLRAVEQMQQVFSYRNAYVFPQRVFLMNVHALLENGRLKDETVADLMRTQARDFFKFIRALESQGLDANSKKK